jgi:phage major head subunit gpT-like protein
MHVTPSSLNSTFIGFNTLYQSGFKSSQPMASQLAMGVPSAGASNVYAHMAKLLRMRKWVGERDIQNIASFSYQLDNVPYEMTVEVERTKLEDDQIGIYNPLFSEMGAQTGLWMDDLIVQAIKDGDDATLGKTYDGVAFFSTAHPIDPAGRVPGTQSNNLTAADLTETTLDAAMVAMAKMQGADGRVLGTRGTHLVVPPQLELKARKLVEAAYNSSGATNVQSGLLKIVVLPQLADEPGVWYVMDLSRSVKPFVSQTREAPRFVSKTALDSENVFNKDTFVFGAYARGAAGYGLWFLAVRNA